MEDYNVKTTRYKDDVTILARTEEELYHMSDKLAKVEKSYEVKINI